MPPIAKERIISVEAEPRLTRINPVEMVRENPAFLSLKRGLRGRRFNSNRYERAYAEVVNVRDWKGEIKELPHDGHNRIAMAADSGIEDLPAWNVTENVIKELGYQGQNYLTTEQYIKRMRELNDVEDNNQRIAAQIFKKWEMDLDERTNDKVSALSALLFLGFSNIRDKTPSEIATILASSTHSKHPGFLIHDQYNETFSQIQKAIVEMAQSINNEVGSSYQDFVRYGIWVVQEMLHSPKIEVQESGKRQIRGLFNRPELVEKLKEKGDEVSEADRLEARVVQAIHAIDTTDEMAINDIRPLNDILFEPRLSLQWTIASLEKPEGTSFHQHYNNIKQKINGELLNQSYNATYNKNPSAIEAKLLVQVGGTTLLDTVEDEKSIAKILNTVVRASTLLEKIPDNTSANLKRLQDQVRNAESISLLTRSLTVLEKALSDQQGETQSSSGKVESTQLEDVQSPFVAEKIIYVKPEVENSLDLNLTLALLKARTTSPSDPERENLKLIAGEITRILALSQDKEPDEYEIAAQIQQNAIRIVGVDNENTLINFITKEIDTTFLIRETALRHIYAEKFQSISKYQKWKMDAPEIVYMSVIPYLKALHTKIKNETNKAQKIELLTVKKEILGKLSNFATDNNLNEAQQKLLQIWALGVGRQREKLKTIQNKNPNEEEQLAIFLKDSESLNNLLTELNTLPENKQNEKDLSSYSDPAWEQKRSLYKPKADGIMQWFADKFTKKHPQLSEEDRDKVTFMIEDSLKKIFPDSHSKIIQALSDKENKQGLDAFNSMLSERLARLMHETGWGKETQEFDLIVGLFVKRSLERKLAIDENLLELAATVEDKMSQFRHDELGNNKTDPHVALLEFLLYTDPTEHKYTLGTSLFKRGGVNSTMARDEARKFMPRNDDGSLWVWTYAPVRGASEQMRQRTLECKQQVEEQLTQLFQRTFFD